MGENQQKSYQRKASLEFQRWPWKNLNVPFKQKKNDHNKLININSNSWEQFQSAKKKNTSNTALAILAGCSTFLSQDYASLHLILSIMILLTHDDGLSSHGHPLCTGSCISVNILWLGKNKMEKTVNSYQYLRSTSTRESRKYTYLLWR